MHKNYRRKIRYNPGASHYPHIPAWAKTEYWRRSRAKGLTCLMTGRFDDFQNAHPHSIYWDWI